MVITKNNNKNYKIKYIKKTPPKTNKKQKTNQKTTKNNYKTTTKQDQQTREIISAQKMYGRHTNVSERLNTKQNQHIIFTKINANSESSVRVSLTVG